MEHFLEVGALNEIFKDDESVGSLQEYANRVRQLHHRFLESQLASDQSVTQLNGSELTRFANDAEFLATEYTNPLVVERVEGLPPEDVPSRQIVQDALALAGTIFEFLGDTVAFYENQNVDQELIQLLGRSALLYLKAGLCYGLGLYESGTSVILKRILGRLSEPTSPLTLQNLEAWSEYLMLSLLSREVRNILRLGQSIEDQTLAIREQLRRSVTPASFSGWSAVLSPQGYAKAAASLSLIDASLNAAKGLIRGESALIEQAQRSFFESGLSIQRISDYERLWVIRTSSKLLARIWTNSPWLRLEGIITRRNYLRRLVEDGYVTFWSSQIAALEMRSKLGALHGGYLDARIKRVVIHMPTSAGKTLLAELAIARQVFSDPGSKCVYVAPSRALCDQVASGLAERLSRFNIRVTTVVSDNDISIYENSNLFGQDNVIVVTQEKLSYLIRQNSSFIWSSKLFIFDELHNIGKSDRGWIYEELISLLLQHPRTKDAKMLFFSAIMPNHLTVQEWVDPEKLSDTISELWQPTRLLKGVVTFQFQRPQTQQTQIQQVIMRGDLVYARYQEDLSSPLRISNFIHSNQVLKKDTSKKTGRSYWKRDSQSSDNQIHHAAAAALKFSRLGPVLVYCPLKIDTVSFCDVVLRNELVWDDENDEGLNAVVEFVIDTLSNEHPLVNALRKRVGFHHAGLPRDVRNEIEYAFRKGLIKILAATTTLVEGVNFPVKTLLLSDYCQRYWNGKEEVKRYPLTGSDFRNIAGRAGRALYETEGQVIFIQSISGYPYGEFDVGFEEYFSLKPESPSLNITSALVDEGTLLELNHLIDAVDNGSLSQQQLLFDLSGSIDDSERLRIVNRLQTFTLLLQTQALVGDDEESFVRLFQGTFLGKQKPEQAPQVIGTFSHRSASAINSLIDQTSRTLFAQTGLKISTCRILIERIRAYWTEKATNLSNYLYGELDYTTLYSIGELIYDLGDDEVDPQPIYLARNGKGSKTKQRLEDDKAFLTEWILFHDTLLLRERHFSFINDSSWCAEQYINYTQQTLGYRAPWLLSAFWFFSRSIIEGFGINLSNTRLGRELLLLPSYAKFGVNTPAAALFSTLGVSPSQLSRQLGSLYEEQYGEVAKYDYPTILNWLLRIEPKDLEATGRFRTSYIRRLTRLLESLRPLDTDIQESERIWEVSFPIAGWQYYDGDSTLRNLKVGTVLYLKPEPNNSYDPNAIEIFFKREDQEVKLGYVPRYLAADIKARIEVRQIRVTISRIFPSNLPKDKVHVYCVDNQ